jgi:protein TonB
VVLATVEIGKLKAKLAELKKANKLVAPELAGQDHAPQYPGGISELMKFLSYNIKYPVEAEHYGVEGRVLVNFFVETDGTVSDIKVVNADLKNRLSDKKFSKYSEQDKFAMREKGEGQLKEEALRVVRKMPNWDPAMRRGEKVRVKYTLPISFRLK